MERAPKFFEGPGAFRAWLERHHSKAPDVLVGFVKVHAKGAIGASMTWPESVAEALCFGWIDGVRRRLDEDRYTIRFTPRRKGSLWSAVNIRLIAELERSGKMTDAGRAAFESRPHKTGPKSEGYKAARKDGTLDAPRLRAFKKDKAAWKFFEAQPPGYRRAMAWWVMNARQEETRDKRLARLVKESGAGKRLT